MTTTAHIGHSRPVAARIAQVLMIGPLGLLALFGSVLFTVVAPPGPMRAGDYVVGAFAFALGGANLRAGARLVRGGAPARRTASVLLALQIVFGLVKLVGYHEGAAVTFIVLDLVALALVQRSVAPRAAAALVLALVAAPALRAPEPAAAVPQVKLVRVEGGARAHPGGALPVRAILRGRGRRHATVRFTFARATATGRGGRRPAVDATLKVPAGIAPGRYRLRACVNGHACKTAERAVTIAAAPAGSSELIGDALAAGQISEEQALAYRAYAAFGSPRLPAAFQGDEAAAAPDDSVIRDLQGRWTTLPLTVRRALLPYLQPPAARDAAKSGPKPARGDKADISSLNCESDQERSSYWRDAASPSGRIRMWWNVNYPAHGAAARRLLPELDAIYAKFKALTGRDLPSDADNDCFHGSDGALDIYLIGEIRIGRKRARALTIPSTQSAAAPVCGTTPSFVLFDITRGAPKPWELAHELFHAWQNTYVYEGACDGYSFVDEGTATWAAGYALPNSDGEHAYPRFNADADDSFSHGSYESWPFYLYMERVLGAKSIVDLYYEYASHLYAEDALDAALPGGFRKRWREFTRYAWNQPPAEPSFAAWDRWYETPVDARTRGPLTESHLFLAGDHSRTAQVPLQLASLARDYRRYTLTDDTLRLIRFKNTLASDPDVGVQAVLTLRDGTQRIEDWSGRDQVDLCRDSPSEDVTGIVLMFSWAHRDGLATLRPDPAPTLDLKDSCDEFPYRYQVLDARISTHAVGTNTLGSAVCTAKGFAVQGDTDLSGDVGEQPVDSGNQLGRIAAIDKLAGRIAQHVPALYDRSVSGCAVDHEGNASLCKLTLPREDAGGWNVGFSIEAEGKDAADATLRWQVPAAQAGHSGDADPNAACNVLAAYGQLSPDETKQTVSLARLASKSPQTFELSGEEVFGPPYPGSSQALSYTYSLSITVRRVDENGRPFEGSGSPAQRGQP
jgi:hypothetical protein